MVFIKRALSAQVKRTWLAESRDRQVWAVKPTYWHTIISMQKLRDCPQIWAHDCNRFLSLERAHDIPQSGQQRKWAQPGQSNSAPNSEGSQQQALRPQQAERYLRNRPQIQIFFWIREGFRKSVTLQNFESRSVRISKCGIDGCDEQCHTNFPADRCRHRGLLRQKIRFHCLAQRC